MAKKPKNHARENGLIGSYRKLNVALLKDETFVADTKEMLQQLPGQVKRFRETWERFKEDVKQLAIKRSSILSCYKKKRERELRNDLCLLHEFESKNPGQGIEDIAYVRTSLITFIGIAIRGQLSVHDLKGFFWESSPRVKKSMEDEKRHA